MSERLAGKVAIVTGAASGIGCSVARRFVREGASVIAVDLDRNALRSAHEETRNLTTLAVDVREHSAPAAIVNRAIEAFEQLDIVANIAGICDYRDALETTDEIWNRAIDVNLTAMFRICRQAIPFLQRSGSGRIINTASILAERAFLQLSAYTASKHGVAGLTKALAVELGRHAVTANYILPGATLTGITKPLIEADPDLQTAYDDMGVLKRMAHPDELASAFLFLASDEAAFITGHGLAVDGGALARL